MKLEDLINKNVIRTKGAILKYGVDNSYTSKKLGKILKVTESHAVYETKNTFAGEKYKGILNHYWLDDNWEDYDELITIK